MRVTPCQAAGLPWPGLARPSLRGRDPAWPQPAGLSRAFRWAAALVLAWAGTGASADQFSLPEAADPASAVQFLSFAPATSLRAERPKTHWSFEDAPPAGIERKRLRAGMKVRGWRVKQVPNLYFGQARVARKWGLGLVMEHGSMAFGMNHRGIEVRKSL